MPMQNWQTITCKFAPFAFEKVVLSPGDNLSTSHTVTWNTLDMRVSARYLDAIDAVSH